MIVGGGKPIRMFSVWYWTKNMTPKWVTVYQFSVYQFSKEEAIKELEELPDFHALDSIKEL